MKTIRPPFVSAAAIRHLRTVVAVVLPAAVLVASGCENPVVEPPTQLWENFDANDFDATSNIITNSWMGFTPGTQYVYEGTSVDEGIDVPHRVEINVTNYTKVIEGVVCLVTYDLDYQNQILVEAELAFYAQDIFGNVWRMGEYPEEYEDGEVAAAPTWIGGIAGAVPGISMLANPTLGSRSYSQGWGPGVGFTDRGVVDAVGQTFTGPLGEFTDVLVIAESAQGEAGEQLKYWHQPGDGLPSGNIHVNFRGVGEQTREFLHLTQARTLTAQEMEQMAIDACALERSALAVSPDVYGLSQRMLVGGEICPLVP